MFGRFAAGGDRGRDGDGGGGGGGQAVRARGALIALDTNELVRFLVGDDPAQTALAPGLIEAAQRAGEPVLLPTITLVETAWVLGARYRVSRADLVSTLSAICEAPPFLLAEPELVREAVARWAQGVRVLGMEDEGAARRS